MREQYEVIGQTAGKIYQALEKKGSMAEAALKKEAEVPDSAAFNQAIGWLAREDKIFFEKKGKGFQFSLVPQPAAES